MSKHYDEQFKKEIAKEIRELNLRIKELEKENSFLKRSRKDIKDVFAFLRRKSISGISICR